MARKRYKPLENLLGYFNIKNSSKNKFNEYDYINEKIQSLINQEKELQKEVETNRPILKNKYLETLISSESAASTDVQKKLEMLGINFVKKYFCVAVISESQIYDRNTLEKKILSIDFDDKINKYICSINRDMVLLMNFEEESFIFDFLNGIENDIIIKSKFGVGNIYSDISNITVSYKEARVANGYRSIDSAQKIYMYSQVNNDEIFYFYSLDSELKLIEALSSGKYEKACSLIEHMIEKNKLSNVKSYVALNNFFINLELTMLKLINRHNISILVNDNILKDSSNTITEKKEYVLSLAKEICDAITGKKKDSKQVFWAGVKEYINENYKNNCLSLESVADKFDYNISSFSSEFKKNVGITFIKYLNKIRIENAIIHIENGEQFSNASKMVGFNSEDTFRRSFKKQTGTTPSKYFSKNNI